MGDDAGIRGLDFAYELTKASKEAERRGASTKTLPDFGAEKSSVQKDFKSGARPKVDPKLYGAVKLSSDFKGFAGSPLDDMLRSRSRIRVEVGALPPAKESLFGRSRPTTEAPKRQTSTQTQTHPKTSAHADPKTDCACSACFYGMKVQDLLYRTQSHADRALLEGLYGRLVNAEVSRDYLKTKLAELEAKSKA